MASRNRDTGFTLLELLVVIAILGVLFVLAMTAAKAKSEQAKSLACMANLRQLYAAIMAYSADHQLRFPENQNIDVETNRGTTKSWYVPLREYLPIGEGEVAAPYFCPANPSDRSNGNPRWTNYAINENLYQDATNKFAPALRFSQLQEAKVLLIDSWQRDGVPFSTWYTHSGARGGWKFSEPLHGKRVNVLFTDGHVESPRIIPQGHDLSRSLGELQAHWF